MTHRIDKKLQQIAVAEFTYRHEAEFAAGFLEDAGIPYRLQVDDAGGDLGLTLGRPAIVWVRAIDFERAKDVLDFGGDGGEAEETE